MRRFLESKAIFWDFDGVLLDSMPVRDSGFVQTLSGYPKEQVEKLLDFHRKNGGWSRYVKFKYFIEEILGEQADQSRIQQFANNFSEIMLKNLANPSLIIQDSLTFVKSKFDKIDMHIVSGSDGQELNTLCLQLGIEKYFKSINGSPTPKEELVKQVLENYGYHSSDCSLIGDSINDWQAANANNVTFYGYNNVTLKPKHQYIESFSNL
ncbi:HAD hydrolase-like protein [Fulvivirga ulvae]|uniref:HAD family hydrolase n=1 Tax=Fulvivirga ulvae TaxID=2904245 RepID=UPI001F3775E3|nr:HAD hydrolase-like protein [Fulvivirga ulvae]UII31658.1 HAD hydrolase-like protein [Fulvivirga ulvae]